jgi:hypothetical protein
MCDGRSHGVVSGESGGRRPPDASNTRWIAIGASSSPTRQPERLPRAARLGRLRRLASGPDRGRDRRDQGTLRVRVRRCGALTCCGRRVSRRSDSSGRCWCCSGCAGVVRSRCVSCGRRRWTTWPRRSARACRCRRVSRRWRCADRCRCGRRLPGSARRTAPVAGSVSAWMRSRTIGPIRSVIGTRSGWPARSVAAIWAQHSSRYHYVPGAPREPRLPPSDLRRRELGR